MIIYRPSDRIPIRIGDVTFWLSPLTLGQRTELLSFIRRFQGTETVPAVEYACETIRRSLKQIDGVKTLDGETFAVEVGPDGNLTEECVMEILTMDAAPELIRYAGSFAQNEIRDLKLEGVEIDFSAATSVKKKSSVPTQVH